MTRYRFLFCSALIFAGFGYAESASAQNFAQREMEARLGRVEQKLRDMNGFPGNASSGAPVGSSDSIARANARMDAIDEKIRQLSGNNERTVHILKRLEKKIDGLSEDVDYRLTELESGGSSLVSGDENAAGEISLGAPPLGSSSAATNNDVEVIADIPAPKTIKKPSLEITVKEPEVSSDNVRDIPNDDGESFAVPSFSTPREHYNYAFGLMNKAQYAQAGDVFSSFLQRYPDDKLRSNVYYWLGETYYVREDYKRSIDNFRLGFEENPKSHKAPDNLLKLAMSLEKDGNAKEACLVLDQLIAKYPSPEAIRKKAEERWVRASCQKA